jgi:hypothetical protein
MISQEEAFHFYVARRGYLGFVVNQQMAQKGYVDKLQIE